MKKILIAAAVATTAFVTPQAFAQAKNFEGFSVGLNVNSTSSDSVINSSTGSTADLSGQTSSNAALQAQYNFALGNNFVLGVGATYDVSDIDLGSARSGALSFSGKRKDGYSVYVAPGFALDDSWLIYGKIASIAAKFEATGSPVFTGSVDMTGVGYGFGAQKMLSKNIYLQAEYMQNKYDDKTTVTSVTTQTKETVRTLSFGIGYKF